MDSDSDDDAVATQNENARLAEKINDEDDAQKEAKGDESMAEGGEDEDAVVERRRKKPARVIEDDDDEDEDEVPAATAGDVSMVDETVTAAGNENAPDS